MIKSSRITRGILMAVLFIMIWMIFFLIGQYTYLNNKKYVAEWDIWYVESNKKSKELNTYINSIEEIN